MEDDVDLVDHHGPAIVRASKGVLCMSKGCMVFFCLAEEENVTNKRCRYVVVGLESGEIGDECWYVRDSRGKGDYVEV